jgi:ABC-type sugar transport system ATPase subunit
VLDALPATELSIDEIVQAMLGEKAQAFTFTEQHTPEQLTSPAWNGLERTGEHAALRLDQVTVPGKLHEVSLEAPVGAIVGVAGLEGSGHREVLALVAGLLRPHQGSVRLPNGDKVRLGLRAAVRQGIALVPGDRRRIGLMLDKPIWENIAQVRSVALSRDGQFLRIGKLRRRAHVHVERLGVNTPSEDQEVGFLSGGNQQKVVFAKWLEADPSVLLLDDPTRGIDIGARAEIYGLMRGLAEQGVVQVLASTDPRELAMVCNRVFVFYKGRICATLDQPNLLPHTILEVMNTGLLPSLAEAEDSPQAEAL